MSVLREVQKVMESKKYMSEPDIRNAALVLLKEIDNDCDVYGYIPSSDTDMKANRLLLTITEIESEEAGLDKEDDDIDDADDIEEEEDSFIDEDEDDLDADDDDLDEDDIAPVEDEEDLDDDTD